MGNRLEQEAALFLTFKNHFDEEQMILPKPGEVVPGAQSFADVPMLISDTLYLRYDFLIGLRNYLAVYEDCVYNKEIEILFKITPFAQAVKEVLSARLLNREVQLKERLQVKTEQVRAKRSKEPEGYLKVLHDVSEMCPRRMGLTLINRLAAANKVQWEMLSENPEFAELLEIGKYHHYFPMREFLPSVIQCLCLSLVPDLLDHVQQQKGKKKSKFFQSSQELTVADIVNVCETVLEEEQGLDDEDNHAPSLTSIADNTLPTGNHVFFARISEFGIMLSIFFTNLVQCLCMIKFFEKENTVSETARAVPLQRMCI